jgi:hypothetical protein
VTWSRTLYSGRDEGKLLRCSEEKIRAKNILGTMMAHSLWKICGKGMAIVRWSTLVDKRAKKKGRLWKKRKE